MASTRMTSSGSSAMVRPQRACATVSLDAPRAAQSVCGALLVRFHLEIRQLVSVRCSTGDLGWCARSPPRLRDGLCLICAFRGLPICALHLQGASHGGPVVMAPPAAGSRYTASISTGLTTLSYLGGPRHGAVTLDHGAVQDRLLSALDNILYADPPELFANRYTLVDERVTGGQAVVQVCSASRELCSWQRAMVGMFGRIQLATLRVMLTRYSAVQFARGRDGGFLQFAIKCASHAILPNNMAACTPPGGYSDTINPNHHTCRRQRAMHASRASACMRRTPPPGLRPHARPVHTDSLQSATISSWRRGCTPTSASARRSQPSFTQPPTRTAPIARAAASASRRLWSSSAARACRSALHLSPRCCA